MLRSKGGWGRSLRCRASPVNRLAIQPRLLLALLAAALVAVVVIASCGGDDFDDDPRAVLTDTFTGGKSIRSGEIDLSLRLDLKGLEQLEGPVALTVRGPFSSNGKELPDLDLALNLSAGGQTFRAGAVSTGETGYLSFQGQAYQVGDELYKQFRDGYRRAQSESGSDKDEGPTFESLGIKPLDWVRNPRSDGEEEVGGAETLKVSGTIDVRRFLDDISRLLDRAEGLQLEGAGRVPGGLSAKQREQVERAVKDATISVWSGKDDRTLRRVAIDVQLDVPEADRKDVGGLSSGRIAFRLTISELNEEQKIEAPKNARPFSELEGLITGQAPAQGSGSAGSGSGEQDAGSGGTATTPQSPAGPKAYLDCLEAAGQDVAKIQRCASLLE